jgi:hypothetical protein
MMEPFARRTPTPYPSPQGGGGSASVAAHDHRRATDEEPINGEDITPAGRDVPPPPTKPGLPGLVIVDADPGNSRDRCGEGLGVGRAKGSPS